jgi:hypothetical protein
VLAWLSSPRGSLNADLKVRLSLTWAFSLDISNWLTLASKVKFRVEHEACFVAYPAPTKTPKKEAVTKVATAVLSITAKIQSREKKKATAEGDLMDTVIIFIFRAELRLNL